ncbi:MAG: hypothetical protein K2X87_15785 [Gemmataceae bacterium]|nr:hypothetical protein [Gemmataceae bacterium]
MRMRLGAAALAVAVAGLAAGGARPDDADGLTADGYVQKWLVLAPIPFVGESDGTEALGKEQIKGEAKLMPKAGDKTKAGDKELTWKEHTSKEPVLDLNAVAGDITPNSVAYAVAYVVAPEDLKAVMKTGSDDQAKAWLNGKEVYKNEQARAHETDQEDTEVALKKGVNVLVVKVVNESFEWKFSVRFTDKDGKPVKGLKVQTKP